MVVGLVDDQNVPVRLVAQVLRSNLSPFDPSERVDGLIGNGIERLADAVALTRIQNEIDSSLGLIAVDHDVRESVDTAFAVIAAEIRMDLLVDADERNVRSRV